MEPNAFIAEVYRRMAVRDAARKKRGSPAPPTGARVAQMVQEYCDVLPEKKESAILDIGYGDGWFIAACRSLGYKNLYGAEFDIEQKPYLKEWGIKLYQIEKDIGEFLAGHSEEFDFIHLSHVIEHIPKHSLLFVVDALYQALRKDGILYLRTPNMEGPTANSSYYVTLAHEYGFCGSNLQSLLDICGFDEIQFLEPWSTSGVKQKLGALARWPFLKINAIKHRLFGVNRGGQFRTELVMTARRRDFPPFFDAKYR